MDELINYLNEKGFFSKIPGCYTYREIGVYISPPTKTESGYCALSDIDGNFHYGDFETGLQKLKERLG